MGIKHFFTWFRKNFKNEIKSLQKKQDFSSTNVSVDNLMIDLNGMFHSSTQKIFQYGAHKPPPRLLPRLLRPTNQNVIENKTAEKELKVFEDICLNIDFIFKKVKPNKRLILCVDGPAPLSKQNQQRQRRFRSANENADSSFDQGNDKFDPNCLTPGTKFMDSLNKYIEWYVKKQMSDETTYWNKIEVVFSNEKCAGEGEHKLINYLRKYGEPNDASCIFGMDADLIMLALGTHLPHFYILREDTFSTNNDYFLIDIGTVRTKLSAMMDWKGKQQKQEFNHRFAINDFIFMCFMVGNDFLPHVPSLEIIEGGVDFMLDVYKNVGEHYGHLTNECNVTHRVLLQKEPLKVYLGTISQYDKGILENKLLKKDKFFPDIILEQNSKLKEGKYELDILAYRKQYYTDHFNSDVDTSNLCVEYLEGMQWVLEYYTHGVPDWKWCFKHHYAPFAFELAEHLDRFKHDFSPRVSQPSTPFQQLLSVLPPKSSHLIPYPLSSLLTDPTSVLKPFCPETFKVDLSGKRQEWEGTVLLPMVDFTTVIQAYSKLINKVDKKNLERNKLGISYSFKYDKSSEYNFVSSFGKFICKIKEEELIV
jgi:5'-3' exonuclease